MQDHFLRINKVKWGSAKPAVELRGEPEAAAADAAAVASSSTTVAEIAAEDAQDVSTLATAQH